MRLALALVALVIASPAGAEANDTNAKRDMQIAAVTLSMARLYSGKIEVTSDGDAHFADNSVRFHREGLCRIGLYGTDGQGLNFSEVWDFEHLTGRYYLRNASSGVNLIFEGDRPNVRCFEIPGSRSACVGSALVPSISPADVPTIVDRVRDVITDCRKSSSR